MLAVIIFAIGLYERFVGTLARCQAMDQVRIASDSRYLPTTLRICMPTAGRRVREHGGKRGANKNVLVNFVVDVVEWS